MPRDYQLHQRLGFRLSRLSRLMQARLESGLAEHNLTRAQWCVLSGIEAEGLMAPSELADHIGMTRPAISRLLKAMVQAGLVKRGLTEEDGRSRQISLTDEGRHKLSLCWPVVEANQDHYLNKLSAQQRDLLDTALNDLIRGEEGVFEDV